MSSPTSALCSPPLAPPPWLRRPSSRLDSQTSLSLPTSACYLLSLRHNPFTSLVPLPPPPLRLSAAMTTNGTSKPRLDRAASKTMASQTLLPRLPVPKLEDTMNKYLKALEVSLSHPTGYEWAVGWERPTGGPRGRGGELARTSARPASCSTLPGRNPIVAVSSSSSLELTLAPLGLFAGSARPRGARRHGGGGANVPLGSGPGAEAARQADKVLGGSRILHRGVLVRVIPRTDRVGKSFLARCLFMRLDRSLGRETSSRAVNLS